MAVATGDGFKVLENVMLCKETELDLVAGDVEKGWIGLEDLSEDGMRKVWDPGTGDVNEGEGRGED